MKDAIRVFCKWNADKELIVDEQMRYTGAQLDDEAKRMANALRAKGVKHGDTVAMMGAASCRFYAAYLAVQKLGAVNCNIHVRESAEFIARTLEHIEARVLMCSGPLLDTCRQAIDLLGHSIALISLDDHTGSHAADSYSDLMNEFPAVEPEAHVSPADTAAIILSSGSTGVPKGVVHSNANYVGWLHAANRLFGRITSDTRFLVIVGTSFAAWPFSSIPVLFAGGTLVLRDKFEPESFCQAVESEKITMVGPVPTMIRMLDPSITERYDLSSFETVLCAGEPPTNSDIERILSWADTEVRCLYLASESSSGASTVWLLKDQSEHGKAVCAGRPIPGADVRVVDPQGSIDDELPAGESGEVLLRGPTIATGYWKNEALSRERFIDGWWRSGDLGHLDQDGYLSIEGRIDNIINTGGIKVNGEEVESCLVQHPAVDQVGVIGVKDPKWGERIEAHLSSSTAITESELADYVEQQGLATFKRPKRYHFHDQLPLGVTGKLDRVSLRKQYGE